MGSRHIVQTGERFGRGVVIEIEKAQRTLGNGAVKWYRLCTLQCDCGGVYKVPAMKLNAGGTRSCGCLHREGAAAHMTRVNQTLNESRVQVGAETPCAATHREAMRVRRFDPADPDYKLRWSLWTRFHITLEEYSAKLAAQGGRCAICRKLPGKTRLHVDHDHRCCPGRKGCGRCNRDLLCFTCNGLVGAMERLGEALLGYLAKWGQRYASDSHPDSSLSTCGNAVLEWSGAVLAVLECDHLGRQPVRRPHAARPGHRDPVPGRAGLAGQVPR